MSEDRLSAELPQGNREEPAASLAPPMPPAALPGGQNYEHSGNFVQSSFLGGEWSPMAQGHIEDPRYRTALNTCRNAYILEEGTWVRRSGSVHGGYTFKGKQAKLFQFAFGADAPYACELSWDGSNSFFTFWRNWQRVTDTDNTLDNANVPAGSPATFTTLSNHGWSTNDVIILPAPGWPVTNNSLNGATLINRQFKITSTGMKTFTMVDAVTGTAVNATDFTYDNTVVNKVSRIAVKTAPYTSLADMLLTRNCTVTDSSLQANVGLLLLNPNYAPVQITGQYGTGTFATFTKTTPSFVDGPYESLTSGVTGEPDTLSSSAASGSVTLTAGGTSVNNGTGFQAADIGRNLRILTEPATWASGTNYNAGDTVRLGTWPNSQYYVAVVANTGNQPDQHLASIWVPYTNGARWTWATITARADTTHVTATINGDALQYSSNITVWLMDFYNWFYGWPASGVYAKGRLWLSGITTTQGRFDASATTGTSFFNFAPSDRYGVTGDSNAISYTLTDPDPSNIMWMTPDPVGLILGLEHSEYFLRAGNGDNISASNIQAIRSTAYGSGYLTDPLRVGSTAIFIDRTFGRCIELVSDVFSNKLTGRVLNKEARHMGRKLFNRLALVDTQVPMVFANDKSGGLFGCSYRRIGFYATQPPEMQGWHRHDLGTTWTVSDIVASSVYSANATLDQAGDTLYMVTNDGTNYHVELMQPIFDTDSTTINSWFEDSAPAYVQGRDPALDAGSPSLTFYGLQHLNGKSVHVVVAGLDCGAQTVASGKVTVNYGSDPDGLLTAAYLNSVSGTYTWGNPIDIKLSGVRTQVTVPVVIGCPFTSEGQLLRPDVSTMLHQPRGPGLGKTRRVHMFASLLQNTPAGGVSWGTSASNARPMAPQVPASSQKSVPFSGVFWNVVDDAPSFDGMLYWSATGAYSMAVCSIGGFLNIQER